VPQKKHLQGAFFFACAQQALFDSPVSAVAIVCVHAGYCVDGDESAFCLQTASGNSENTSSANQMAAQHEAMWCMGRHTVRVFDKAPTRQKRPVIRRFQ
jgi:hypothetical protein